MFRVTVVLVSCAACAAESPAPVAGTLSSGGVIAVTDMPAENIQVGEDVLVVWGMTEVPAGSRLQAAWAMVDVVTRAELLKFVQVGVGSLELDVEIENNGVTRHELALATAEVVSARLPSATPIQHGWTEVGPILRLVGRLEVPRDLLRRTLAEKLPAAQADAIVTHLFRKP